MKKTLRYTLIIVLSLLLLFSFYIGYIYVTLPDVSILKKRIPGTTSIMNHYKAKYKKKKYRFVYRWVSFDRIPQILKDAVRITEDFNFYHHKGIDIQEIKKAVEDTLEKGKKLRGASTITQQLAKNLYLSTERSIFRKIKEYFITKRLEKELGKDRIFEIYLNVIELGKGIFGFESAAQVFFHKHVWELNLEEILRIVAVIPKPLRVTPLSNSGYLKWRVRYILKKLLIYKKISQEDYDRIIVKFLRKKK